MANYLANLAAVKPKNAIIRWVQVIAWMLLIYTASTDAGSAEQSSRIIGPILRWFNPSVTNETIAAVQLFVRKCAHLTVYAILALLVWRAISSNLVKPAFLKRHAVYTLIIGIIYAMSDEFHQSFVPTRSGTIVDVLIDSFGVLMGLGIVWFYGRWRKWW